MILTTPWQDRGQLGQGSFAPECSCFMSLVAECLIGRHRALDASALMVSCCRCLQTGQSCGLPTCSLASGCRNPILSLTRSLNRPHQMKMVLRPQSRQRQVKVALSSVFHCSGHVTNNTTSCIATPICSCHRALHLK